jgi:hypothetical protein
MNKRLFTAFAIEDAKYRTFLSAQAKLENSPFEFTDMSVKEPWSEDWKTKCRTRIRGCHGVVGLVSKNSAAASGQLWEIKCAYEEKKPVMLMWINDERPLLPASLKDKRINIWSWANLKSFIERL